jgi:vitamin B12 transporter
MRAIMVASGLTLILGSGSLLAQEPAVITGRVIDRLTGGAIGSADVMIEADRRPVGEDGRFRFVAVRPGNQTLRVRAIGYAAHARDLVILPGQTLTVVVELSPVIHQIDSIRVLASREPVIGREELSSRGSDLATALNGWEGIVVSRTGHGNEAIPQIRGSAADEVLVLVDGFSLNDPFTGRADLSRVPVQDIESISLLRGVQSARWGSRAVAGVLQISTRQVHHPEVMVGIGSAEFRQARAGGGIGVATLALSMEALPRNYMIDLPSGGEGRRVNAGGEIWSLNGRAHFGVDLTARGSLSDRGLPGTTVNPTVAARGHDRSLLLGIRRGTTTWISSSLQFLDTRAEDPAPPPGFLTYDNHTWGWGGTAELGIRSPVHLHGWAGEYSVSVDGRHDRFDGDAVREGATFTRAGSAFSTSLSRTASGGTWTIAPAVRLDWYTGQSRPLASGRVDVHLARDRTSFSAAVGNGMTIPALADLLFRDGVGVAINPDLRPERVRWEGELGIGQAFSFGGIAGSLRLAGFYGQIDDMILWTPNFRNIWSPGNFAVLRRGGEASLEIRPRPEILISGSATLSSVVYDIPGGAQVPYRPRSSYSLQGSWTPGGWRVSFGWNHLGTRFSRNRGMNPLSPFDLFNFGAERQLGRFSLRGEIRDLTDARPVYIAGFPTPGRTVHLSLTMELP